MNNEDKQLLLQDLSARLPYRVKCHFKYGSIEGDVTLDCIDNNVARFEYGWYGRFLVSIDADYIKPYLRPMPSMTEEEKKEFIDATDGELRYSEVFDVIKPMHESEDYCASFVSYLKAIDWLNAHHFDYRNLIEKDLALGAPEGMYN